MMICRPEYNVIYHGEVHPAGIEFQIDPLDADEMALHGTIEEKPDAFDEKANAVEGKENDFEEKALDTRRRPGRPRKGG